MSKKKERPEKLDANELLLISVRIDELRSLKMRLSSSTYMINFICGTSYNHKLERTYTTSVNAINTINLLISEIEIEKKRLVKRSWVLLSRIIKRTKKTFKESPQKMVPLHSRDLLNGYVELTEVKDDTLIPHLLLLDSGKIESAGSVRAKEVLSAGPSYESDFTNKKIRSHTIMTKSWPT